MNDTNDKKNVEHSKRTMIFDHMTVGHLKAALTTPADVLVKHMTTAHLSNALDPKPQPQAAAPVAQPAAPSAPPAATSMPAKKKQ
jgi:hypothetical protein